MSAVRDAQRAKLATRLGLAALVAVIAAGLAQLGPEAPQENHARLGKPVLPGFETLRDTAREIRITVADESYTLERLDSGWTMKGMDGYRIRETALADLANGLQGLVWGAARTRDPEKFNRIGLGDPREGGTGALIELINAEGKVETALITGRRNDFLYGRLPDDSQAFRVEGDLPPLFTQNTWLDLDILDIHEDAISAVRLYDARGASLYLQRSVGSSERAFRPAPPYQDYKLVSRIAVSGPAMALTRFAPIGVKPAAQLKTKPVARHITETHDGLEVDLSAYREADGYFVTLRAIEAGQGANRGAAINERAQGWAFELTEIDWQDYTPRITDIVQPPE